MSLKVKKTKSGFSQPFQHFSLFLTQAKKKKEKEKVVEKEVEETEKKRFHSWGGGGREK